MLVGSVGLIQSGFLCLISMYPNESLLVFFDNVKLIGRHMLLSSQVYLLFSLDQSLTWPEHHPVRALLVQFIGEVSPKARIKMLRILEDLTD